MNKFNLTLGMVAVKPISKEEEGGFAGMPSLDDRRGVVVQLGGMDELGSPAMAVGSTVLIPRTGGVNWDGLVLLHHRQILVYDIV